jgi:lipopolysaccharide export system permease protein
MTGFDFERTDENLFSGSSQTQNIRELQGAVDSLEMVVNRTTTTAYNPLLRDQIFIKDPDAISPPDTIFVDRSAKRYNTLLIDSIPNLSTRQMQKIYSNARQSAISARNSFSFDESTSKEALNQLYRSKNEWHRKLALPVSIFIFFLVGAPLGAIIRKGGLGMPIVISVIFFVIYYIISMTGEKMAKEGTWSSLLGMWISSIVLFPLAVYLTQKATNDSALLDFDWYIGKYKHFKEIVVAKIPQSWKDKFKRQKR